MPSSVVRLVALDHDRLLRLARRACAPGPSRARWRDELVHLVRAHAVAETEVLGPALAPESWQGAGAGAGLLHDVDQDLARAVDELADLAIGSASLDGACERLQRLLRVHADSATELVLAPVQHALPRRELRRLGGAYESRRDRALHEAGAAQPPPRRLDLSRAELYELARRAGIEGRSAMSRGDLISELQRRQGP